MPIPIRQNLRMAAYLMRKKLTRTREVPADRRARAALRLQPRLPGLRQDPVPDRDPAQAPHARRGVRRDRGVRRADGLDRRRRAAAAPPDRGDRGGADQAQALRLPLHERRAAEAEDGPLQALAVLLLRRPPRRAEGAPRRGGRPRGRLRRGRRGDPRGEEARLSGSRRTRPSSRTTRRRPSARCSTS